MVANFAQVVFNWFWVTIDGSMLHKALARLAYFPSILRMSLREGPNQRWYDRIDQTVILGALPFRSQSEKVSCTVNMLMTKFHFNDNCLQLVKVDNVTAVLSYNETYELNYFTCSKEVWLHVHL